MGITRTCHFWRTFWRMESWSGITEAGTLSLERYTGSLPENQRLLQSISDTIQGRTGLMALLKDLRAWEATASSGNGE